MWSFARFDISHTLAFVWSLETMQMHANAFFYHSVVSIRSMFSLVCYVFYLLFTVFFKKNTEVFMFLFGWLKMDWRPWECSLQCKFFYLSTVSRITYHLRLIFKVIHGAIWYHLCNLRNVKKSFTFSKVSLQLYQKWHSSMGASHVFQIAQMVPNRAKRQIYFIYECPFKDEMMMEK